ncbi:expressed protein [Echinococcus multilocularis]|uniref:Expressed protein n=1 Tax=Echinococcus multilocularis TaxID=6211 RepID=A0A068Y2N9_ECHMU|nr:expressed protein [Echinococcus multilocularis]
MLKAIPIKRINFIAKRRGFSILKGRLAPIFASSSILCSMASILSYSFCIKGGLLIIVRENTAFGFERRSNDEPVRPKGHNA